jgi:ABC-type Fe3+ transport system substrate-binding protein
MLKKLEFKEEETGTVAYCSAPPPLTTKKTENGVPLLQKGAINIFMNMPCPLKVLAKRGLKAFADEYNLSHKTPAYSPVLYDGDSKGIEGELKNATEEEEIPEILVASGLHTVLSGKFKKRFIDTGIYSSVTTPAMLAKMPAEYQQLVTQQNIGIIGTGYWSLVCDLSVDLKVPYPSKWTDLLNPRYKDLISVHGYHGKASIAAILLLLRERIGENAISAFGSNIRNIWHFAEILKRMDSPEPRRTPFNLLPNAATVQMPSKKYAGILEFSEGPVLAPLLMYVKTSKKKKCQPVVDFFLGPEMRKTLLRGDFHLADELNWKEPFCFPDWNTLLQHDYEEISEEINAELRKGLRSDAFKME